MPPAVLLRFLREHRSEWADNTIDAYSAAAVKAGPCSLTGSHVGTFGGQVILPLAHTIEHEEVNKNNKNSLKWIFVPFIYGLQFQLFYFPSKTSNFPNDV